MLTKTIRSRFDHEIGETVEGCKIIERREVIPPDPVERRRGVYEFLVEVPPATIKASKGPGKATSNPERDSFTRSTPEEKGGVIRRLPSR